MMGAQGGPSVDVPVSIDYRELEQARQWAAGANTRRPWRLEFFATFVSAMAEVATPHRIRVLELGSGPGFLAEELLRARAEIDYVGLDASAAVHHLAKERLGASAPRAQWIERSLRDLDWPQGLGKFDLVVTNQAVHELRHKRYARGLHAQALEVLVPGGVYLVCDHFLGDGGMSNDQLYMTADEQKAALHDAGFRQVERLLQKGDLVLHRATA